MKFRCERDALVEALGTAGRAVAEPGRRPAGALRGPGRAHRRPARAHRHRPRAHHPVEVDGVRRAATASRSCPAGWRPTSSARSSRQRSRSRSTDDEARIAAGPLAVQRCACSRPTSSRGSPRPAGEPVTLGSAELRRRAAPGGAGAPARRRPPDPHRRAARRRGRRAAPRRHRLVPPRGPRPAGHQRAARGPAGARAVHGPAASCSGCSAAADEVDAAPRRARGHASRSAARGSPRG